MKAGAGVFSARDARAAVLVMNFLPSEGVLCYKCPRRKEPKPAFRRQGSIMAIEVQCPGCSKTFRVAEKAEGKKGACPHCGTFIVIAGKHFDVSKRSAAARPDWRPGAAFPAFSGHQGQVQSLRWSHGGRLVLSGGDDGTIRLWETDNGREELCLEGHEGKVYSAVLGLDGGYILSGGSDKSVKLWKISSGKCLRTLEGHEGPVNAVAFCPRGRYGLSASSDKTIRIWELASGKCIKILKKHKAPVTSLVCDPRGEYFISGGYDKFLRLWRTAKWKQAAKLKGHGGPVLAIDVNADGGFLISGGADRTAAIWDTLRQRTLRVLKGHLSSVDAVAISFDGAFAATGGADWMLRIWDAKKGKRRFAIETEGQAITAIAFDPESPRLAAADSSGLIRLYDARTGEMLSVFGGAQDSVTVLCPHCRRKSHLPADVAGAEGRCPFCDRLFTATVWSPHESERLYERAVSQMHDGLPDRALGTLEEAIQRQFDNHDAHLKAITCTCRMARDFEQSNEYAKAVEMLQRGLDLFERASPWPGSLHADAGKLVYEAAFLAARICRFNLDDSDRALEFCKIARAFRTTPELEDLVERITEGAPPPELR